MNLLFLFLAFLPLLLGLTWVLYQLFKDVVKDYGWWFVISAVLSALGVCLWIALFIWLSVTWK